MWTTGVDWKLDKTLPGRSHSPLLKRANYEDLSAAGYGCWTPSTPQPVPWRSWHRLPSWQAYSLLAEHEASARVASLLARQLSLVFRQVVAAASGLFPLRAPHPQALQTQCRAAELAFHHSAAWRYLLRRARCDFRLMRLQRSFQFWCSTEFPISCCRGNLSNR